MIFKGIYHNAIFIFLLRHFWKNCIFLAIQGKNVRVFVSGNCFCWYQILNVKLFMILFDIMSHKSWNISLSSFSRINFVCVPFQSQHFFVTLSSSSSTLAFHTYSYCKLCLSRYFVDNPKKLSHYTVKHFCKCLEKWTCLSDFYSTLQRF